jgi:L-ascorbate metabolism protein UlaG (beta-lactamase superfamily)
MVITYLGEGSFRIQSGEISLVTDPLNDRVKPDVILRTSVPHPHAVPEPNAIIGPGEYEISGIAVKGIEIVKESKPDLIKAVYRVVFEDIALGFMGELFDVPEPNIIEGLGDIDILFIPAGAKPYLDAEKAAKLTKQIEPHIVIPSFYKNPKEFLDEMGQKSAPQEKLVIKKKDLLEAGEGIRVICLTA